MVDALMVSLVTPNMGLIEADSDLTLCAEQINNIELKLIHSFHLEWCTFFVALYLSSGGDHELGTYHRCCAEEWCYDGAHCKETKHIN